MNLPRRHFIAAAGLALVAPRAAANSAKSAELRLATLERRLRGRIGLTALDTGSGRKITWRAGERFAMCSTFKWFLVAAVLARCERGQLAPGGRLSFSAIDLRLPHSPISTTHISSGGMPVAALCEAAIAASDNLAANTLLRAIGGPPALTAWLRGSGDSMTRLDRFDLALNENLPGDPRDTTTPDAMIATMRRVILGDVLTPHSRALVTGWMRNCKTGLDRLRAGLPPTWIVADKTGTGTGSGPTSEINDLAVAWPPHRPPILIASYISGSPAPIAEQNATHARIARIVSGTFA
ncbi:MAG TPA: class A beta-lactamase [Rhizomicrobium sp.]|nr:class A beta-lactamase [Rhizomicrobium sp.]